MIREAVQKLSDIVLKPYKSDLFLENEYTPPIGSNGLRLKKTITPKTKASFNEVFGNTIKK
jgi:hypothetical protein